MAGRLAVESDRNQYATEYRTRSNVVRYSGAFPDRLKIASFNY